MEQDVDQTTSRRLQALRHHRNWILLGTTLCMIAAFVISWISPKIYRATTYILISESKIDVTPNPAWEYSFLPTYVQFVESDAISLQAIQRFHLDQAPYRLTPHRFLKRFVDVQIPRNTRLLQIDVEFPDAHLAADLANYIAQSAVGMNAQISAAETLSTQNFLKKQLDQASARLAEAESKSLEIEKRARIEDREKELKILLSQKEQVSNQVEQLHLALMQYAGRAKSIHQSLKTEPATLQLKNSILSDRFLEYAVRKLAPDNKSLLSTTEEAVNPVRQDLAHELADSRANAAADRAGLDLAKTTLAQIDARTSRLLAQLTQLRSELSNAEQNLKLAREGYESATRDYRNASVTVTAKSQDLKQIDPALIPERPVRPRIIFNTVAAGFLGLVVLSGIALGAERIREAQSERLFMMEQETASVRRS